MDLHISKKSKIILGLSAVAILIPIASSLFIIFDTTEPTTTSNIEEAQAYIKETNDTIYFPTVSDAIIYANEDSNENDIVVIPGERRNWTQSYIVEDCTLASNDNLYIPYEIDENDSPIYHDEAYSGENVYFADNNQSTNTYDEYLRTEVIISYGIELTNYGKIYIGGKLGVGTNNNNQRPTGHVAEDYAQISMEYNSSLINAGGGIIYSYGYIKERLDTSLTNQNEPSIENKAGSIFYTPITIYDFYGGGFTTSALYPIFSQEQGRTPFHIFDFPNIQAEITFVAGSKMYCYYDIYMDDTHFNGTFYIIGEKDSDCLFGLDSGSVSFYYSGKKDKRSSDDKYEYSYSYLDFDTSSNNSSTEEVILSQTYVSINSGTNLYIKHFTFNFELYGYEAIIDTSRFFIPFSYKFIINVKTGASLNIQYDTKFLAGSSLIIEEGAYAEFDANVIFYPENSKIYNSVLSSYYPDNLPAAICLINGAAIFKDSFGGILTTSVTNALVQTSSDYSNSVSVSEAITSDDSTTISLKGSALLTTDLENENISSQNLQEGYTYISKGNYFYATKSNDPVSLVIHDQNGDNETLIVDQTYPNGTTLNLSVFYDTDMTSSVENVLWKKDSNEYVSIDDGILTIDSNAYPSAWGITTITITATVIYSEENNNYTLSGTYALSLYNFTSCFEKGTLISTKRGCIPIESLTIKDEVLSFNHFTGKFEYRPISLIVNHGASIYEIMNMHFSDGSEINLIGNHGLFDKTLNKYVDICIDNCTSFINHDFVRYIDGKVKLVKLIHVNIERRMTECYTCFSYGNLNTLANNFLNITSIVYGFYNLFNYLENMQYDEKEIKEDIDKYGLTSYEELKDDVSKDIFEAFNGKYINIAIGKGLLTQDSLMDLINNWLNKLVKNNEAFTNYEIY